MQQFSQLLVVSSGGLAINLWGMYATGHHHHGHSVGGFHGEFRPNHRIPDMGLFYSTAVATAVTDMATLPICVGSFS